MYWHCTCSIKDGCTYKASSGSSWLLVKLKKLCYFPRSDMAGARRRKFIFMIKQVFPAPGEVWFTHNARAQWTLGGEGKGPNGQSKELCLNFPSYCLGVWIFTSSTWRMTSVLYNMDTCFFLYGIPLLVSIPLGVLEYSVSSTRTFYTYNHNFIIKTTTQNSQIKTYKGQGLEGPQTWNFHALSP